MRDRRWRLGLSLALATIGASCTAIAQPLAPPILATPTPVARLGTVRVKIDPAAGEQDTEIRKLLGALPFVQLSEPADYLVTTNPDFPLDLVLHDLRQPSRIWQRQYPEELALGEEPQQFAIGNLADPKTPGQLAATLTAAARVRTLLDRSLASMQGVRGVRRHH